MINISKVSKNYITDHGRIDVYNDFSEVINDGEFIVLTGESGSGKTTLLKMLLKEEEPDLGSIYVDGENLKGIKRRNIPFYRRKIGVVFQDYRLIQELSVYDNLLTAILATGGAVTGAEKKIVDVLTMLGIDSLHKRLPKEMSGGQQQKVCLARAMINNPRYLLVDEPTGNLDPASSAEILRLLSVIHDHGVTVIMATHDMSALSIKNKRQISLDKNITGGGKLYVS
ncbi:cell division ATP-binding protein FtsE [Butyrivibrio sp. AE3009]|uniref:cell division ATP-binding protein FtsE n=1 Tax=Butyrivibrio sp. AE3009 TaxID=1280666 RepID=UPI0003B54189|nr:ATP-binding cassette domain-containing protein [Butyrivibrio sp. AE3009]